MIFIKEIDKRTTKKQKKFACGAQKVDQSTEIIQKHIIVVKYGGVFARRRRNFFSGYFENLKKNPGLSTSPGKKNPAL